MDSKSNGFTLIEVLVIITLIGIMTGILVSNFSSKRLYLREMANAVVAEVRGVQQRAISGATFNNQLRCGYGIEQINTRTYRPYAGPQPAAGNSFCTSYDHNFGADDIAIGTRSIIHAKLEFKNTFDDIFFEPPDPRTYINNNSALTAPPSRITIGAVGSACTATTCKSICVYTSGAINVVNGATCP
jgi:type II secretory pathway pseudopilin PulG